jgi:sortase B
MLLNFFKRRKKRSSKKSNVFKPLAEDQKTPLIKSIDRIRPRDIPLSPGAKMRKTTHQLFINAVRYTILTASTLMFIGSFVAIILYILSYIQASEENRQMSDIFHGGESLSYVTVDNPVRSNVETLEISRSLAGEVIDVDYSTGIYNAEFEKLRSKILDLKRQNPDVWGWITVENTNIDYPIMFSGDNFYYLVHSPNKKTNSQGAIFADGRTRPKLQDNKALVVYGHNMTTTSTMFAALTEYTREDVFQNRLVTITTLDGIYTFEVFSVYNTSPKHNYIRTHFYNSNDFLNFVRECKSMSMFEKEMEFGENDMLLTLSTCTVQADGRRWAIHAKLIGISK